MVKMVTSELGLLMPERNPSYPLAYRLAGIMEFVSRLTGKPPRLNRYSVRVVGRPYHYLIDAARQDLNFTPSIDLMAGLRDCLKTMTREKSAR